MVDEIALTISVVSIMLTVIGFIVEHFRVQAGLRERIAGLEAKDAVIDSCAKRLDEFSKTENERAKTENERAERIKALEVKMELFWDAVSSQVISMLKHPGAKRRDILLDKLGAKSITLAEMEELKGMLICDVKPKTTEALAAALVLAQINVKLYDAGRLAFRK